MLIPSISNETNQLQCVLLGVADQSGPPPKYEETYDPKSRLHIAKGTYPEEQDLIDQLEFMQTALKKHGVEVLRPQIVHNCNQIFSRDIAFVVEDCLFISNILPARDKEIDAIQHILEQIPKEKIRKIPEDVHVEGGDVIVHNEFLFVGFYDQSDYADYVTARTNVKALTYLSKQFPQKNVIGFELNKSNDDPYTNTLHLDCCFQPIGKQLAIVCPEGFMYQEDVKWIENHFGLENLFVTDKQSMFEMQSNLLSIRPDLVISEPSFTAINKWLTLKGIEVVTVPYDQISKQGGLFRCTTLPLIRKA
jgi:N-dimethylarginine dimethylaminohydrolase